VVPGFTADASLYRSLRPYATVAGVPDTFAEVPGVTPALGPIRCPDHQVCCGTYDDRGCNGECCSTTGPNPGKCCEDGTCCRTPPDHTPYECCGGSCVDSATFRSDVNNCGTCGHKCPDSPGGSFCCDGLCFSCPGGPIEWLSKNTTPGQCHCDCNCAVLSPTGANCECGAQGGARGNCTDLYSPDNCGWCEDKVTAVEKCCHGLPTVVLGSDNANCGDCDTPCAGLPQPQCCGGECKDLSSDPANCGACGTPCNPPGRCTPAPAPARGQCVCPPPLTYCEPNCVNLHLDPLNCGQCGNRCLAGEQCCNGTCACDCSTLNRCPDNETCCSGQCANLDSDPNNCGACGQPCFVVVEQFSGSGWYLEQGQCVAEGCTCPTGLVRGSRPDLTPPVCCPPDRPTFCRLALGSVCVDLQNSTQNCGTCGHACPTGTAREWHCCSGVCVNWLTDNNNCNACGKRCASGQRCCNGNCLDANANCGRCGHSCPYRSSCVNGKCQCDANVVQCGTLPSGDPVCCSPGENCCQGGCAKTCEWIPTKPGMCEGTGVCDAFGHCKCPPNCVFVGSNANGDDVCCGSATPFLCPDGRTCSSSPTCN
jgi:hypothetical protein